MSYPSGYNPPGMSAYYNLPPLNLPPPPPPPPPPPSNYFPPVYQEANSNQYYGNDNYNMQYLPPALDISRPPPIPSNFDDYGNQYPEYPEYRPASDHSGNVPVTDHRPVQYPILPQLDMSRPPPPTHVPTSYKSNRKHDRDYSASDRSYEVNSKHYSHSQNRSRSTHSGSDRDYSRYEKSSRDSRKRETVERDYDQKRNDFSRSSESKDQRRDAKEPSSRYVESRYSESRRSRESSSYRSQSRASDRDNYSHNRQRERSARRYQDRDSKSRPRESASHQRESTSRQLDRESSRKSASHTGDRKEETPRQESRRHESINRDVKPLPKKTLKDFETSERNLEDEGDRNDVCNNMEDVYDKIHQGPTDDESCGDEVLQSWYRSSPADQYYSPVPELGSVVQSTARGRKICEQFREKLLERGRRARPGTGAEPLQPPRSHKPRLCKHKTEQASSSSSSSSSEESECDKADHAMQELERKQQHPRRLHSDMWYNDSGEMNDGPLCRCSARTRRQGIRHGVYAMETKPPPCDPFSNNADKLFHYRITISPPTNFLIKSLTVISHDEHEFLFSGFSLLSHYPLTKLPSCKVIRFNIEYTILYVEEQLPLNYTVEELELFEEFLFIEILELVDLDVGKRDANGCSQFHLLPRWERALTGGGGEVLAVCEVLRHLMRAGGELMPATALPALRAANEKDWQAFVDGVRGMIVTYPGKKPCSMRVDQLDRSLPDGEKGTEKTADSAYPEIVHFGIRPSQLSYAGNPEYKKAWRDYLKYRHLVANMAKPSYEDKRKLESKEARLQDMRTQSKMKRDVTIAVSAEGFYRTGLMCDVVQHAMLIPVLISHLRFHKSLQSLETTIDYRFENRALLQLALTHPSYRKNFGTNPDHARNSLTNCGIRQPEYGDRRIHYMNIRKRGINTLINIMSRFGKKTETESAINHNERLEFLGDAVVEFLSTIHLFRMFPSLEEGGLATYRAAIVQNQQLAVLARKLGLEQYMLYAHGSDLCHDLELRHAMANCFEALMGALFLDGGIDVADKVFALAMFADKPDLLETWNRPRLHVLQEQEPLGDRRWIPKYPFLQKLTEFENAIGIEFKHIRLLARVFTDRSMGFTNLTLGSNQRLEFLGDTVLQLISSEYLYKHFPEHHEGHLSLLRSSLVNNRTQAVVCDDLAMCNYAVYHNPKVGPKTKDKADLLEAFLGALYIEKNLVYCHTFCSVTLFPRLREFIMNQEWNDPKSKLQQCCLTLRTMDGSEPDIPIYKVIECVGPTNTRVYTVAVYFRGERLSSARGHYIQEAEMNAAKAALANSKNLFPQLDHQKRVIAKSMKEQKRTIRNLKYKMKYPPGFKEETPGGQGGGADKDSDRGFKRKRLDKAAKAKEKAKLYQAPLNRRLEKLPKAYRLDRCSDSSEEENFLSDVSLSYLSSESEDGTAHKKIRVRRKKTMSELSDVTEGNAEDAVGEDADYIADTIECDTVGDTVKRDKVKYNTVKGGTVRGDTAKGYSAKRVTVKGDAVKRDAVKGDAVKRGAVKGDAVKEGADKGDADKGDADKGDAVKGDTVRGDKVEGLNNNEIATAIGCIL